MHIADSFILTTDIIVNDTTKLREEALFYHANPRPGKTCIALTKPTETQHDLALAYSPGVAEPVREIANDPHAAYQYTNKGNLIAVISDGTAVLGLGNMGALASKPVMEGKAVLFKRFADIDVFDIEVNTKDPQAFINTVVRIAPTFGGINLEDIKAPECFEIERALVERLNIPVFHDDQHGTAIIASAGLLNALELQKKHLDNVNIVCLGAGAAGIATMRLLVTLGARREKIFMVDRSGIIHTQRHDLNPYKFAFASQTEKRTLAEACENADVFIGVSEANMLTPDMLKSMAPNPIVFALANPDPEIEPKLAFSIRKDLIIATGRSDYPNQVNNVLGFPYIFRGALDVHARCINQDMQIAAVHAIRALVHTPVDDAVKRAYPHDNSWTFGPNYIIPKPLDPRLKVSVSAAVAKAAVDSGVATAAYPAHYPPLD